MNYIFNSQKTLVLRVGVDLVLPKQDYDALKSKVHPSEQPMFIRDCWRQQWPLNKTLFAKCVSHVRGGGEILVITAGDSRQELMAEVWLHAVTVEAAKAHSASQAQQQTPPRAAAEPTQPDDDCGEEPEPPPAVNKVIEGVRDWLKARQ